MSVERCKLLLGVKRLSSSKTIILTSIAVAAVFLTAVGSQAEPTQVQYELVMSSIYKAIDTQKANIAKAQSYIANPATQPAGAALLKASSDNLDRYNSLLLQTNKVKLERKDPPMAAIDLALSDSAATNSALVAAKNYEALARNAQNFGALIQLQRGVSATPSTSIAARPNSPGPIATGPIILTTPDGPISKLPPIRRILPIAPVSPTSVRGVVNRMPANAPISTAPLANPSSATAGATSR